MMNAILLYSEIPKGMKSYGPKAIVPIGKLRTPLIVKQIRTLQKSCKKIYIIIGFDKEKIIDTISTYGIKDIEYIYYPDYTSSNDCGALIHFITTNKLNEKDNYLVVQGGVTLCPIKQPKNNAMFCIKNNRHIPELNGFNLNIRLDYADKASYLFYDTTEHVWIEMVYLTQSAICSIKQLIEKQKIYTSMFLFECLNTIIDFGIDFDIVSLNKNYINKINHHKQII
jgi:hypothetical protein